MLNISDRDLGSPHIAVFVGLAWACATILGSKFWLVTRININWDEFYFLTLIHEMQRGELQSSFLTQFTQLFRWLPTIGTDEIGQIMLGRVVMTVMLSLTAWLIWKVAMRWIRPVPAFLAPLAFLACWPVLKHGGSFRYDTMVAFVTMSLLAVLLSNMATVRRYSCAGLLAGIGAAVSMKISLFTPLIAVLVVLDAGRQSGTPVERFRYLLRNGALILIVATLTAAVLFLAHHWSVSGDVNFGEVSVAQSAAQKTILESGLVPQYRHWVRIYDYDRAVWLLMFAGLLVALVKRQWQVAAMVLALSPILYYRNSFPYFYVVMLAPASVLVAMSATPVTWLLRRHGRRGEAISVAAIALLLVGTAIYKMSFLGWEFQSQQRAVVRAVHTIFPAPVPYVDHCGMIATFRKVGPFLSTWGVEVYRAKGHSLMGEAIAIARPPMVLVDSSVLDPGSAHFEKLLPEDRRIIENQYLPYWGPIRVAGAQAILMEGDSVVVEVPFPGAYRLAANGPVLINAELHQAGSVVNLTDTRVLMADPKDSSYRTGESVRLVWAAAAAPPSELPSMQPLFSPL